MSDVGPRTSAADGIRRHAILAGLIALVSAVTIWFAGTAPGRLIDGRLHDVATTAVPPPAAPEVVIVAIDEPSFADLGLQWPWPRSVHARLVESLRAAGARAIGVDLVFAEGSRPEEDDALTAALGPDVVLASDETLIDAPEAAQVVRTEPLPELTATGARSGLASMPIAPDGTVRSMPPWPDSFAIRVLEAAGIEAGPAPAGSAIALAGPSRTYPTVSYYQALDASLLPEGIFRDRIVLVGLSLQVAPTVAAGGADAFATAWTTRTDRLTAGVELHANVIGNLLTGTYVRPAPFAVTPAAVILAALLAGLLVFRDTRPRTAIWGALGIAAFGAGVMALLALGRTWLPPAPPAFAFVAVLGVQGVFDYARERRNRRAITNAFRYYLAPELVERLARDPSLLRLGGELRTLTILFCDVRGFTAIAERMKDDPHRLTRLVNSLLDPLSEEVLRRGGTIDKYIGDCLMAFWNAPLDDPDHADHAIEAALAMANAARRFSDLVAEDARTGGEAPMKLAVGIGINTGDAVVGNMGSTARFDYTVLGDAVNLASRLESLCRTYEVPIVIGEATRAIVSARYVTAFLDRVAVKGRSETEAIYTVLGPAEPALASFASAHDDAVAAIRAGRLTPGDPGVLAAARDLPQLAAFYRTLSVPVPPPAGAAAS